MIRQMRYYIAVVEAGSFSEAAEASGSEAKVAARAKRNV